MLAEIQEAIMKATGIVRRIDDYVIIGQSQKSAITGRLTVLTNHNR